jgi:hypothetical protein
MSAVCVLTPMLIGAWPAIASAIAGVAGSLGFTVAGRSQIERQDFAGASNTVETELAGSEILQDAAGSSQSMRIEKDGVAIEFRRDERGRCTLCVSGPLTKAKLEQLGRDVAGRVTQQFAYHKLVTELKKRNCSVVEEAVQQDQSIRVRIRLNG